MTLYFREIQKKDFPQLQVIIKNTWNYENYTSKKIAKQSASLYLYGCLIHATFSRVAILDGQPVGLVLAKNKKKHPLLLSYRFRFAKSLLALCSTSTGRQSFNSFARVEALYKQLSTQTNFPYEGELTFFVVDPTKQNLGIGNTLFQAAMTYFKQQQVNNFYLYTDTLCNYGFYDHYGMTKVAEMTLAPESDGYQDPTRFFLYDYRIPSNPSLSS